MAPGSVCSSSLLEDPIIQTISVAQTFLEELVASNRHFEIVEFRFDYHVPRSTTPKHIKPQAIGLHLILSK